jgi:C4-dicarboxylate-specific signal transduction histidine kinase
MGLSSQREVERLKELQSFEIIDTPAHPDFDGLTRLAASICKTPIALTSLIDENRQWFKSKLGTDISETSREQAICRFTILQDDVLVISDASKDERVSLNHLVQKAGIRFYAGAPLITKNGHRLGTLCALDYVPRTLSDEQTEMLWILSQQVMAQLERHKARHFLPKSSGSFESLVEHLPFGIISEDRDQNVLLANQAVKKIFELSHLNSRYGHTSKTLSHLFANSEAFQRKSMELVLKRVPSLGELLETQTGKILERDYIPIIESGEYQGQIWIYRDVNEKLAADKMIVQQRKQMLESSRLAALGEMAGEVAHEINNPLAIIRAKVSIMKREAEDGNLDSQVSIAHLSKIEEVVIRISKTVAGLSSYAREGQPTDTPSSILVRDLIENTVSFCRDKFEANKIDLKIHIASDKIRLTCYPVQISQVLLNLLNNAFDAVDERTSDGKEVRLEVVSLGGKVQFTVSDNGPGVPEKIQDKLFNPFFTTKPPGKGTGLGLSLSKTIIELHKGAIELDRTIEKGARFVVRLPDGES